MKKNLINIQLFIMLLISVSCKSGSGDVSSLDNQFMNPKGTTKTIEYKSSVSTVKLDSTSIIMTGINLDQITFVKILKPGSTTPINIDIASRTINKIIGTTTRNVAMTIGDVFSVIVGNVYGQSTVEAVFSVANRSISVNQLSGALGGVSVNGTSSIKNGQTLVWYLNNWTAVDAVTNSQNYVGLWNVETNIPAIELQAINNNRPNPTVISPKNGDYFIVQGSGSESLNCFDNSCSEQVSDGDWVMWNDISAKWDIVKNIYASSAPTNIPWTVVNKTGSKLQDISDLSGNPIDGKTLVYSSSSHSWVYGNPIYLSSGGTSGNIVANSITGNEIKNGSVTSIDLSQSLQDLMASFVISTNVTSQITAGGITASSIKVTSDAMTATDVVNRGYLEAVLGSWGWLKNTIYGYFTLNHAAITAVFPYADNSSDLDSSKSNSLVVKKQTRSLVSMSNILNGGVYTIVFQDSDSILNTDFSFSNSQSLISMGGGAPIIKWNPDRVARTLGKHAMYTITLMGAGDSTDQTAHPYYYISWIEF
jgi:hypothetical protein